MSAITDHHYLRLEQYLCGTGLLSKDDVKAFASLGKPKRLNKGEYFIREGMVARSVAFTLTGLFRSFHTAADGAEMTYCIIFPNDLMTAYSSYILDKPSVEHIEAITDVEFLLFPKDGLESLVRTQQRWLHFVRFMAEQQYVALEKRLFQMQKLSAFDRYQSLIEEHPEYIRHIPLQYLASYLGITQRHLSRIRKGMQVDALMNRP